MNDAKEIQELADTRGLSYEDAIKFWELLNACTVSDGNQGGES